MNETSLEGFIRQLDALDEEHRRIAQAVVTHLADADPELAALAVKVFEDPAVAGHWLTTPVPVLGERRPLELLTIGEREAVIDCLGRIEYGMFA